MSADLSILGITPDMIEAMQQERDGKASWLIGNDAGATRIVNKQLVVKRRPPNRSYPFRKTEVGDTFLIRYQGRTPRSLQMSLHGCISHMRRKHGLRFTTHCTKRGIEVTRVA